TVYYLSRLTLEPGDMLVCYTDGLTRTRSPQGEPFGLDRLWAVVAASASQGARSVKSALVSNLEEFRMGEEFTDDVTFVLLQRNSARSETKTELRCCPTEHTQCPSCRGEG